jgi:hypothetical protein
MASPLAAVRLLQRRAVPSCVRPPRRLAALRGPGRPPRVPVQRGARAAPPAALLAPLNQTPSRRRVDDPPWTAGARVHRPRAPVSGHAAAGDAAVHDLVGAEAGQLGEGLLDAHLLGGAGDVDGHGVAHLGGREGVWGGMGWGGRLGGAGQARRQRGRRASPAGVGAEGGTGVLQWTHKCVANSCQQLYQSRVCAQTHTRPACADRSQPQMPKAAGSRLLAQPRTADMHAHTCATHTHTHTHTHAHNSNPCKQLPLENPPS